MLTRPSLTINRRLNASPEKVFAAWTDPDRLVQWFGPAETIPGSAEASMDVRDGGRYRISFRTPAEYHQVGGVYRTVIPNQHLVFTWAWHTTPERESLVTISLKDADGGTLLTLQHEQFFDEAARDGHARGWASLLDRLEEIFA